MIGKKMQEALNDQVNAEFYSAYLYLAMAAYFESKNLGGFSGWMRVQYQEEVMHAMKIYDYVIERGGRATLAAIDEPPAEWNSPLAAFEAAYAHEQLVTGRINKLMDLALEEKDHATTSFLKWFVDEQVEEEASVDAVVQQLRIADSAPGALFIIDRELGQRTFTPPAEAGQ